MSFSTVAPIADANAIMYSRLSTLLGALGRFTSEDNVLTTDAEENNGLQLA